MTSRLAILAMAVVLGTVPSRAGADEREVIPTGPGLTAGIQRMLAEKGFEPGPADGLAGAQTRAAIRRYQRHAGLPVDGLATPGLYQHLRRALADAAPAVGTLGPAPPPESPLSIRADPPARTAPGEPPRWAGSVPLIDTTWQFIDSTGAMFTGRFHRDGTFEGPSDLRFWRWELTDTGLRLVFDNGMGTRIVRRGRFVDMTWLNGSAQASDGRSWDWVANRVPRSPDN